MHQPFQELSNIIGTHTFLDNHKTHLALRANNNYHIQTKTNDSSLGYMGLPNRGQCLSIMKIKALPQFVFKIDNTLKLLCFFLYFRKNLFPPFLNRLRAFLIGTIKRLLLGNSSWHRSHPMELSLSFVPNLSLMALLAKVIVHRAKKSLSWWGLRLITRYRLTFDF